MWLVSCLTWIVCCWTQRIFILRWVGSSGTQLRTKFETWQFATNTNQKNTQLSILLGWVESSSFFTKNENTLLGYTIDTLRIWTHVWLELQIKVNGEKNWWGGTVWTIIYVIEHYRSDSQLTDFSQLLGWWLIIINFQFLLMIGYAKARRNMILCFRM